MNDTININLQIAGLNYNLTIAREEEELVRKAAKQVNLMLNTYQQHYEGLSLDKIFPWVAYQFAYDCLTANTRNDTAPYVQQVNRLTDFLDDYLKEIGK